ncbi:MAG TPA: DUF72 domain-containing protein [Saprospiraceae bacterium]|nr:DUF72 domain-containing protein [Saprospiraceae bacterium]
MDFGKLSEHSEVDFSLPLQDHFYFNAPPAQSLDVLLGATGWSMPQWKGVLYPRRTPANLFGQVYSHQFATTEFNTTYYQVPPAERVRHWKEFTAPEFVFCPKMYQGISQSSSIGVGGSLLPDFLERMTGFDEKLGLIFMQMPQFFGENKLAALEKFVAQWGSGIPLAVEMRHADFFRDEIKHILASLFGSAQISWLITDVAGRRDVSHDRITAPFMCIRFVSTGDIESDQSRIISWIIRLQNWKENGVQIVYFFIHTPGNLTPHLLTSFFAQEWEQRTGIKLKIPQEVEQGLF